jgi:hypothetical protein
MLRALTTLLIIVAFGNHGGVLAATLHVEADANVVSIAPGASAVVTLRLRNVGMDDAELGVWQVSLMTMPNVGSGGKVTIDGVATAPNYIFEAFPSFGPTVAFGGVLPSESAIITDAALGFGDSAHIPPGAASSLIEIQFSASADAAGQFGLMLPELNDDFTDSSWFDASQLALVLFENGDVGASADDRTLVTFRIGTTPEPGALTQALALAIAGLSRVPRRISPRGQI